MAYQLDDILDPARIRELLIQFHGLTGLHSGLVDAHGKLRAASCEPGECRERSETCPSGPVCPGLDNDILKNLPETGYRVLDAGCGLSYALYPVRVGGELTGVLYVCLFRLRENPESEIDTSDVPVLTTKEMDRVMGFFSHLVGLLANMGFSRTELADRQAELVQEQRRFRALFRASGDPILILDISRTLVDINRAAEIQFGYARNEVVGKHAEIMHLSLEKAAEFGRTAYASMEEAGLWRGEWPLRRKDGQTFTGEVTISALSGFKDQPLGFVAIVRDVTRRKQLEAEREKTLTEMEAMFQNTLMGVAMLKHRVFQRINARGAEIFGYRPEEMENLKTLNIHFSRKRYETLGHACYSTLRLQGWHTTEERLRKRDGSGVWIRSYFKALDPNELGRGVIWAFDDVTDRHALENDLARAKEAAEEASQSKSLFLASMSHEIRTPLSGVLSMLQLVREETTAPEPAKHLDAALSAGKSLLTVVGDVLDLARVESGHMELALEPLDPGALVQDVMDMFRPLAGQKGVALKSKRTPDPLPPVLGDGGRIRQVLSNLVSNALKHTDSGHIQLCARLHTLPGDHRRLQFCVEDTGEGIAKDQLDEVFKVFVRAKNGSRKGEGAGLGLAIVKNLVNLMDGEIHIESEPSKGTTVCLSLPVMISARAPSPEPVRKPEPAPLPESQVSRRILVAEDNRVNQIAVRHFLKRRGYEVVCVADGSEAVEAVAKEDFDLVLMDIQMPGMDGEEATRLIRQTDKGKRLPIVALTAYAMKGDRERFLKQGMDDYLSKPVDLALMAETVVRWLSRGENS